MLRPVQRLVTGHDEQGRSVIALDGAPPTIVALEQIPGTWFYELWNTAHGLPAAIDQAGDPTLGALTLPPPKAGSRLRIVDIPPDTPEFLARGAERMHAAFARIGDAAASTVKADSPHPLMHRTESIDYAVVLEGEITLVLDKEERALKAGDVVIQRGTNHAWANRSERVCRMLFVLLDGRYDAALAPLLAVHP
jgi:mannose-6-phosphate isomerase-like protein (cupin superfamily)